MFFVSCLFDLLRRNLPDVMKQEEYDWRTDENFETVGNIELNFGSTRDIVVLTRSYLEFVVLLF
jgi:hypothetical protein